MNDLDNSMYSFNLIQFHLSSYQIYIVPTDESDDSDGSFHPELPDGTRLASDKSPSIDDGSATNSLIIDDADL